MYISDFLLTLLNNILLKKFWGVENHKAKFF